MQLLCFAGCLEALDDHVLIQDSPQKISATCGQRIGSIPADLSRVNYLLPTADLLCRGLLLSSFAPYLVDN
jgi:hypothetical protein